MYHSIDTCTYPIGTTIFHLLFLVVIGGVLGFTTFTWVDSVLTSHRKGVPDDVRASIGAAILTLAGLMYVIMLLSTLSNLLSALL